MSAVVTVQPTTDESYIKSVFLNPTVYQSIKDDKCPDNPEALSGLDFKAFPGVFLRVLVDGSPEGLFWFVKEGDSVDSHIAMSERCRGRSAIEASRKAVRWIFENTGAARLVANVWSDSPAVAWICTMCGLKRGPSRRWINTRNGKPVDLVEYSIERSALA